MATSTEPKKTRRSPASKAFATAAATGAEAAAVTPAAGADQLLTFFAAGQEYAIAILHVREIAEYRSLTPVPGTPPWIRGVMNLRGTVVPAIDLAAKLGMQPAVVTRRTCLLIIEAKLAGDPVVMAIMVDGVSSVIDLVSDQLQEVPSFGPSIDVSFLVGMARIEERLVLLLDLPHVIESASVSAAELLSAIDAAPRTEAAV